jgi:diguanylate cyclase (GGDEF)-like protein
MSRTSRKPRMSQAIAHSTQQRTGKIPLPRMLIVPFIAQVLIVTGLVGYLSYRDGQRAVENLTNQLMADVSQRVEQKLTSYLASPRLVNQMSGDAILRGELQLNLDHSDARREQYLWQTMKLFPNLTWISRGAESGDSMGVWRPTPGADLQISMSNRATQYYGNYYAFNEKGERTKLLKVETPAYDPRTRPWYKEAIAAKKRIWNSIYAGFTPGTIFIAASQPLYDRSGKLVGVSGIDISLKDIQTFLVKNRVTPSGEVFLIERSGLLVASSSQEQLFTQVNGQSTRLNVLDSKTPLIRATAASILNQVGSFKAIQQRQTFPFQLNQQQQFVQVLPYTQEGGLDWLIVIIVPESDVMAQIHTGTKNTILLCLAAVGSIILLNIGLSRWITKPIKSLSQASQNIAQGKFEDQVRDSKIQELSTLSISFNQMSQEIQQSRRQLEDYSRSLEQKVSDRTADLRAEVQRRASAELALQSANEELRSLAYVDGLTQIANRRLFDQRFQQEWSRLKREQLPLSLILCDVDYFKPYNDTYGHQMGDECLRSVAQAIAAVPSRSMDLSARYGGEEFVVLLPNTSLAGAFKVAQMMQVQVKLLKLPHRQSKVSQYVTVSFGVTSLVPRDGTKPEQLLLLADQALYQAKIEGRDRAVMKQMD